MILRIGIPAYNGVLCEETQRTLAQIRETKTSWTIDLRVASGTYPAHARNACITLDISHAKKQHYDFDYFLSMDADIAFDVKNLERLIALDVDIISMAYVGRTNKTCNHLMAGEWGIKPGISSMDLWIPVYAHEIKKCDWVGMGACLIKKEVLEKMEHPYFRHTVIDNGESANEVTEDWGFSISAAEAGYSIYVDCDNRAAHIPH
jgi:hypothetical protein